MNPPLHVRLRQYRVLAVTITAFFMWQSYDLWLWWKVHFHDLKEWQNATLCALQLANVGALKFALEHILDERNDRPA